MRICSQLILNISKCKTWNCYRNIFAFKLLLSRIDSYLKMAGPTRNVYWNIVTNFINSFRPRQIRGNKMGKDYIGNTYFEIPSNPSIGKRKPTRWYTPPTQQDFEDPIPAEWEAWLRMRRPVPPTEEEIAKNLAIAEMKKINADKIETKRLAEGGSLPTIPERGAQSFPVYPDFKPGDPEHK